MQGVVTAILAANNGDLDAVRTEMRNSTQAELAKRYGVSKSAVTKWMERFKTRCKLDSRVKAAGKPALTFDPPDHLARLFPATAGMSLNGYKGQNAQGGQWAVE